jgi:hypothetical protein
VCVCVCVCVCGHLSCPLVFTAFLATLARLLGAPLQLAQYQHQTRTKVTADAVTLTPTARHHRARTRTEASTTPSTAAITVATLQRPPIKASTPSPGKGRTIYLGVKETNESMIADNAASMWRRVEDEHAALKRDLGLNRPGIVPM